jgi:hypothetical protein
MNPSLYHNFVDICYSSRIESDGSERAVGCVLGGDPFTCLFYLPAAIVPNILLSC